MRDSAHRAVAIVGVGAVLPDAPDARTFWNNIKQGRYSISEVTSERWDPDLYYDADPKAPDKTYSKIGGWVRQWEWDPLKWRLPIPPRVSQAMDLTQKWAVVTAREALNDYGYPSRSLNPERTAVILGNAMAGDMHLYSAARVLLAEYTQELAKAPGFSGLPGDLRESILSDVRKGVGRRMPEITEDTMPGELANIIAGRVASIFDFKGPNFVADAACASAMAGISAAIEGLLNQDFDAVLTGGIDANMSPSTFVKFCKIGALSGTGTRPFAEGADGFVMGEGAVVFLIKRLEEAERDGDRIYAVVRGMGGSSDGRGKGITAPNPIGQKLSVLRAWQNAGLAPSAGDLIEGHGTSTRVGDVVEVNSLMEAFDQYHLPAGSVALGSVKSNIGHLKGAAGAAGILKAVFAIHERVLPPSLNFVRPNPDIDFANSPLYVNTVSRPWEAAEGQVRRAGVSAFGFGGTNFHTVLEEYVPGRLRAERKSAISVPENTAASGGRLSVRPPMQGALVLGGRSEAEIIARLQKVRQDADAGRAPSPAPPQSADLRAPVRLAIDYADAAGLAEKAGKALKAFEENQPGRWKALRAKGIFLGRGPAAKVAFLFTGQGSQYVNMLKTLRETEPIVAQTYREADRVMEPLLGKPLTDCIFLDEADEAALAAAENGLKQTAITQPAVLATETALCRVLAAYGILPDMVMGHSLGEYGALVAAGAMPFDEALKAVSARGAEMTRAALDDNGMMAAVFGPIEEITKVLETVDGYVVVANINSTKENVIGGASAAVEKAIAAVRDAGFVARSLPVSHAFHTRIVAPASGGLVKVLQGMKLQPPALPIISNVTGEFYPMGPEVVPQMIELLGRQVASPVQFIKGLETLYTAGARVFIEVGPKRALYGFTDDVLGQRDGVLTLFTNHPRIGDVGSFNQALCGLYAAGLGTGEPEITQRIETKGELRGEAPVAVRQVEGKRPEATPTVAAPDAAAVPRATAPPAAASADRYVQLGQMFADFLERSFHLYSEGKPAKGSVKVCVTGASLGLPGVDRVFDDANVAKILRGGQFIEAIPVRLREAMLGKNVTRLVKSEGGEGRFETIEDLADVIKLAARARNLDLVRDFGFPADRMPALDHVTELAIGAGVDALRDAGIPLVMRYKTTTLGTRLPDRWMLPEEIRDDTGVIFGSAFPGCDSFAEIISGYYRDRIRRERLEELLSLRESALRLGQAGNGVLHELDRKIASLKDELAKTPYRFDRRFLFRVLSMGHSQFAEYIGARGPNTAINAACATGTQAVAVASDWLQSGRCRRVIVISADDITSDNLMEWHGAGFLASGAAATDEIVEEAAIPFDKRRHGLIVGMGGAAIVLETAESARERGIQPICEVLGSAIANSAFHGTRLDVGHICQVMERLVSQAEQQWGIDRYEIAPQMVFVSHETYTPARGGSASAEVFALRHVFKQAADKIVVANTKGATGHPMAVGIEDVVAVKILETGIVPPVANFREVDPELGPLNLSQGGTYPVRYALRLGAGFGSQISMTLTRATTGTDGRRPQPESLGFAYRITDPHAFRNWLQRMTGQDSPELEIVQRTLRVKDHTRAARAENGAKIPLPSLKPAPVVGIPAVSQADTPPPSPSPTPVSSPQTEVLGAAEDPVRIRVMQIVSEKTGYPPDMLELDLDLEADLGIDTVKQAEMFAAIRAAYEIPRDDALKLRDFPTLAHAVQFVYDRRPDLKRFPAKPAGEPSAPVPSTLAEQVSGLPVGGDPVRVKVMQIVAEKTGYPPDMLDLDLDLEADLGIDTVKQAEMFAAIRAAYDIPRDDQLKLRDFPTLAHAVSFVYDRRPDLKRPESKTAAADAAPSAPATETPTSAQEALGAGDPVQLRVMEIVADKTGYPMDMLDLDLDLEADLGIDTVKQAEMFAAIRAAYDIPRDDQLRLRDFPTLAHAVRFVYDRRPDLARPVPQPSQAVSIAEVPAASESGPLTGSPDPVQWKVMEIVAEKTGYPMDMLDPDLDLEADLGIDTVKQAEMFAAIRAAYDIPRDDQLKLRDFPTLAHAVKFVYDRKPGLARAGSPSVAPGPVPAPSPALRGTAISAGRMEAAQAIPRRVPVPRLRPPIDLCKSTGVQLGPDSRVIVMSDQGGVGKALVGRLEKLGADVLFIDDAPGADELLQRIEKWQANGPVQGAYWLTALDDEGDLTRATLQEWREATRVRVKLLYAVTRALYDQITGPGRFLVSATRLGGVHGYGESGATAPLGGAVSGFTKAFKREKSEALVKVVDFEPSRKTSALADLLIDETLFDPGIVEVGYRDGRRWTVSLIESPVAVEGHNLSLSKDTVFLITGAAGSIVSAITADLAAASGGTFHLLDLTPEPDPADPDLQRYAGDRENLKRDLFERIRARGGRATPAMVEKEMARLERSHAALSAINAVREAGGSAYYHCVNLLEDTAVAEVMKTVAEESGRVDVLVHAAGLEVSHLLPDKTPAEFNLVFDVKADGWFNLLSNLGGIPLGTAVVFSSVAGRFGNLGQTDYSAANDLLCKSTSSFRNTRPQSRGIAIDWTAWGGIGMAARGSIPLIMKQAGIDMLPPEAGIPVVRRELVSGGAGGEVVIAQRLGIMTREFDESGGLDIGKVTTLKDAGSGAAVMTGQVSRMGLFDGVTVETHLDPARQPFLYDHQIGGTPVLPGVMGIEGMAEVARLLYPDWHIAAIEDVHFMAPFKFYRSQPRTVILQADFAAEGDGIVAHCRLLGTRTLHGQSEPEVTTHFTSRVRLSPKRPSRSGLKAPSTHRGKRLDSIDLYRLYFHGPAYQVVQQAWRAETGIVGLFASDLPPNHEPQERLTWASPRLIELCFQTAGIWELATRSSMGLPYRVAGVRVLEPFEKTGQRLWAVVNETGGGLFDADVMDEKGRVLVEVRGYRTMALPETVDAALLKPLQNAML